MEGLDGAGRGKSAALAEFVEAYGEQVEHDLSRYHGLDLRDLFKPGGGPSHLTYRRLQVLIDHLPPESATKTAARDDLGEETLAKLAAREPDGYGPWSYTDMRLAAVIDKLSWVVYAVYHSQGAKPTEPQQFPRPGVVRRRDSVLSPEGRAYLERLRARNHAAWAKAKQDQPDDAGG